MTCPHVRRPRRFAFTICRGLAALALALPFLAGNADVAAAADPLFVPAVSDVTAPQSAPSGVAARNAVRTGLLRLDSRALAAALADAAPTVRQSAATGDSIVLPLFSDTTFTVDDPVVELGLAGDPVLSGTIGEDGFAVLVVEDGAVTGQIYDGAGASYRIEPVRGTEHRVIQIDSAREPEDIVVEPPRRSHRKTPDKAARTAEDDKSETTIRLLVAYTHRAAKQSGNIHSDIELAVRVANKSFARGARLRLKLVDTIKVERYNETKRSYSQVLYDLTDGDGRFKPVHERRDGKKADLVALLRTDDISSCGIAWRLSDPTELDAVYGFSVSNVGCIPYYSFGHEIGHNIGLRHDRYVSPGGTRDEFDFGYVNVKARLRTIMAYANKCADRGLVCDRIPYFSDDKRKYDGDRIGLPKGKSGAADAIRTLRNNRNVISRFR